jgi:peptide/nickel transport system substrate-binding protein
VGAAALAFFLAACPGAGHPGPAPDGSTSSGAGRRGGELVVAYPYEPATLNPFVVGGDAPPTRDLVRPLWPGLYRLGPRGSREPWLLAAEPSAADVGGTPFSVRVRLREDAVWSDGKPITADDLRFTWRAVMTSPGIATRDGYDRLSDVVVVSPKEARLVFKAPFARWRDLFSAGLGVLPAHALGKTDISRALARAWPVSGGPFVLKSWTPGLQIVLERNPRAWGGGPLLDRIRIEFVPDPVTALQLYARGQVDVIGPYAAVQMARRAAAAVPGSSVGSDRGATWVGMFLNVKTPALADARVRRALAMCLDRASIVEGLVREQGAGLDAPSGGAPARTSATFSRYPYDAGEAGRLLDAAGWRSPSGGGTRAKGGKDLEVTLASVADDELSSRVLRALNAEAAAVGINLNLVAVDANQFWGSWIVGSRFQAGLLVERDPPGGALRARFGAAGAHNVSRLSDAGLLAALDRSDATMDDADPAVKAPFDTVAALVPVIPLFSLDVTLAARPGVRDVVASASEDGFLAGAATWWREGGSVSPSPS